MLISQDSSKDKEIQTIEIHIGTYKNAITCEL